LRAASWLGALALVVWAVRRSEPGAVWETVIGLEAWKLALIIAVNLGVIIAFTMRWWVLVRAFGVDVALLRLTAIRLAAFGVSYLTPGPQFGGEPLQLGCLVRTHGASSRKALGSIALDKAVELVASFTFLTAAVWVMLRFGPEGIEVGWAVSITATALLTLAVAYLAALRRGHRPLASLLTTLPGDRLHSLREALEGGEAEASHLCREQPRALAVAIGATALSWSLQLGEFWLMLALVGAEVGFAEAVVLLGCIRLAFLLPLPGGLGAVEAALALGFSALSLPAPLAMTVAVLIRARDLSFALGGLAITLAPKSFPRWRTSAPAPVEVELMGQIDELSSTDLGVSFVEPPAEAPVVDLGRVSQSPPDRGDDEVEEIGLVA